MYEIWLAMNIAYETALGVWPALAALLALWLIMLITRSRHLGNIKRSWMIGIGSATAAVVGATLPFATRSGFSNFGYWVDWANWLAIAIGAGLGAMIWVWPLLTRAKPQA